MRRTFALSATLVFAASADEAPDPTPPDELLAPPPAGAGRQLAMDVSIAAGEEVAPTSTNNDMTSTARFSIPALLVLLVLR